MKLTEELITKTMPTSLTTNCPLKKSDLHSVNQGLTKLLLSMQRKPMSEKNTLTKSLKL